MKKITLKELALITDSQLHGDPNFEISGVAPLECASSHDASFFSESHYSQPQRYIEKLKQSQAGVIFVTKLPTETSHRNYLICTNPSLAFQTAMHHLFPDAQVLSGFEGIHPTAVIHPSVKIGEQVQIGPHAVIDKECEISNHTFIGANCYIGPKSKIGSHCTLHPNVTLRERTILGDRVIIQPGAVIGSCGFGYTQNARGEHVKLDQVGDVVIESDVEIGANTTIDRARFNTTSIKRGTKIDNLVQIAHGVEIGEHNLIISQAGVAGSAKTGKYVVLAAQSGVNGHITLDDEVMIAAKAGASKSLSKGKYNGIPAVPVAEYNRTCVYVRKLDKFVKDLSDLKRSR